MTQTALADLLAADLSGLDLVWLMLDGVDFAEHPCLVALGIAIDGTTHPLALVEGSTETTTLARELLVGRRERGLDMTRPIRGVREGATALRRAVVDVFDHPVLARCQQHKIRNVRDKLPSASAARSSSACARPTVPLRLGRRSPAVPAGPRARQDPPGGGGEPARGLAEALTVLRLGVPRP
jgi:hypothetical protein